MILDLFSFFEFETKYNLIILLIRTRKNIHATPVEAGASTGCEIILVFIIIPFKRSLVIHSANIKQINKNATNNLMLLNIMINMYGSIIFPLRKR